MSGGDPSASTIPVSPTHPADAFPESGSGLGSAGGPTSSLAPGPSIDEIDRGVAQDFTFSSLVSGLVASALLIWTVAVASVPGLASGIFFSAQSTPLAPPPWSALYSGTSSAGSGDAGALAALSMVLLLLIGVSLAFAYRALRRLRRSAASRSPEDRRWIARATYLLAGVVAAVTLFVLAILVGVAVAFSTLSSLPPTTTPASFISGTQTGFAVLGGVVAACFLAGATLLALFHHTVRRATARGQLSMLSISASLLIPFGAAIYFAIVATPFEYSAPFYTALYFVGGVNGPWVILTLPCWVLVTAGFCLSAISWSRRSAASIRSGDAVAMSPSTSFMRGRRPTRATVAVLGVAIVVTLAIYAAPSVGSAYGDLAHTTCLSGARLATEVLWTPQLIINAPYGGNGTGSLTQIDPTGTGWDQQTTWAENGSTSGMAVTQNWTVYAAHTALVAGPGIDAPCSSPFIAVPSTWLPTIATLGLKHPSPYSDAQLPQQFNLTAPNPVGNVTSVIFSAGYGGVPTSSESDCPGGGVLTWTENSESVRVSIPFEWNGIHAFASTTISALTNYTYSTSVPGTYDVEDLALEPSGFGSGLAFSYTPC